MTDIGVVNSENACVPVRVGIIIFFDIFRGKDYHIGTFGKTRVERVLRPAQVIGGEVCTKNLVAINNIVFNDDSTAIGWGEG